MRKKEEVAVDAGAPEVAPVGMQTAEVEIPGVAVSVGSNVPVDPWEIVSFSNDHHGLERCTRKLRLTNGYLYSAEMRQQNPDGTFSLSQSSVFVPA
ncbi:MAG TPA: hypothetical protein VIM84_09525 [Gemmatimonadales bacterium]